MSPPLNTSYTDSSHTVPHTSPDREESSRPIERPEVVQSSQGGREAKVDQSVGGGRGYLGLKGSPELWAVGPSGSW